MNYVSYPTDCGDALLHFLSRSQTVRIRGLQLQTELISPNDYDYKFLKFVSLKGCKLVLPDISNKVSPKRLELSEYYDTKKIFDFRRIEELDIRSAHMETYLSQVENDLLNLKILRVFDIVVISNTFQKIFSYFERLNQGIVLQRFDVYRFIGNPRDC